MKKDRIKRNITLGILFLLPVMFVLIMSLSKENFNTLDIVKSNIKDIPNNTLDIKLKDHLTVLAFFGKHPQSRRIEALNLKEVLYDKFKGFKKFQVVVLVTKGAEEESKALFKEIASYEDLRFWHFVSIEDYEIKDIFSSLKSKLTLDSHLSTNNVFIVDTDLNQRGRLDDRDDKEKAKNKPIRELNYYSTLKIDELKNKMSAEDLRVLFTEYRLKRKGEFDSNKRREDVIKKQDE